MEQAEINDLLVGHGRAGRTVVRLKGGDPFVLGRGGEEAEALAAAGVPFEVVPGVTSAVGVPSYAGIPVTHRGAATSFTVVTGHEDPGKPAGKTDWEAVAKAPGTLVILMAMGRLAEVAAALVAHGRPADEPAAAIQWGTTPRQRTVRATLETLAERVDAAGLGPPAAIVVGPVAGLPEPLGWFERRPLHGLRVVVTRARAQAGSLAARLAELGAEVIELPAIRTRPIESSPEIDAACKRIQAYGVVVLTSVNGVDCLFARLAERGRDARAITEDATVVAIGPATAERLLAHGVRADVVPERFVGEGILAALAGRSLIAVPVLVARAREARPELVDGLRALGAAVDEVALYETVREDVRPEAVEAALGADYLTFTSSSTVRNLLAVLDGDGRDRVAGMRVVSIGPITSEAARAAGLTVHAEAREFTVDGLVAALLEDVRALEAAG